MGGWLLRALHDQRARLADRYGVGFDVVGIGSRREGFAHRDRGLDLGAALELRAAGRPLAELPGVTHRATAIEGMRATDAELLVEATASPPDGGEPGLAHMREALSRGIAVVTSNKWPVALHGVELARLAAERGVAFRAESTVLSGTPLLGPLTDGLAGARPLRLRGVLNATANFIVGEIETGSGYDAALAEAQRRGLAERDPSADVDGHDSVAKLMILAALVFGRQLRLNQVERRGISEFGRDRFAAARERGTAVRELASLEFGAADEVTARVEPAELAAGDPLAGARGTTNAVVCEVDPLGEIAIAGPGAGLALAGQGVFSDLINAARALAA